MNHDLSCQICSREPAEPRLAIGGVRLGANCRARVEEIAADARAGKRGPSVKRRKGPRAGGYRRMNYINSDAPTTRQPGRPTFCPKHERQYEFATRAGRLEEWCPDCRAEGAVSSNGAGSTSGLAHLTRSATPNVKSPSSMEHPAMTHNNETTDVDETERPPGKRIRHLREEKGWTIAQLAVRSKVKPYALEQVEEGARRFNGPVLARITKILLTETPSERPARRRRAAAPRAAAKPAPKRRAPQRRRAPRAPTPASTNGTNDHADRAVIVLRGVDYELSGDGSSRDRTRLARALGDLVTVRRQLPGYTVELELPPGRYGLTPAQAALLAGADDGA